MITPLEAFNAGKVARVGWDPHKDPSQYWARDNARRVWAAGRDDLPGDFSRGHALRMAFFNGWLAATEIEVVEA